jgi:nicotinate-nucleotide pyrophosphorylase (carboxylating)
MSDSLHDLESTITDDVTRALAEDVRGGDLTASLVPAKARGHARVIAKAPGTIAGCQWFERCFSELDPDIDIYWHVKDGQSVIVGGQLCEIMGDARAMLTAERSALNFLQMMSGVATRTRAYADLVRGTQAKILDTRKTLPGLRIAQKYAVRVGGGTNHRIGLFDGILIKENHIAAAGGLTPALKAAFALVQHEAPRETMIEVEVENLDQLREALAGGATLILLDNMNGSTLREAVAIAKRYPGVELEASGGVNFNTVRAIAETGVHRISVGSLTKDIEALDLSMRFAMH